MLNQTSIEKKVIRILPALALLHVLIEAWTRLKESQTALIPDSKLTMKDFIPLRFNLQFVSFS